MKTLQQHIFVVACFCCIAISLMITDRAIAQEWSQWRGGNRDGLIPDFSVPQSWPESLKLKWKISVGTGHASPIAAGGKAYMFTRNDGQEVASCIDLATGEMLWQKGYPVSYKPIPIAAGHGRGPKSTPILYNGKLFTLGITGILACFDAGTGEIKWRRKFSDRFKNTYPIYGTAMSPLVDNDLIIAYVGGENQGALIACDVETGEIKWSWDGDGPGYTSPIVAELEGTRQIVTQTQKYCVGISVDTGELLWSIPFTTPYDQNIVTPVLYKQTVIFSGTKQGTMAIKVTKQGNEWSTKRVWYNPDNSMYMSSPVIKGDLLFGLAREAGGYFFCLNAATGRTLWKSDGRKGEYATIFGAGDVLFILTDDARLIIARQSSEGLEPIIQYKVADDQTWASPAPLGKQILVKDVSTLYLWSIE